MDVPLFFSLTYECDVHFFDTDCICRFANSLWHSNQSSQISLMNINSPQDLYSFLVSNGLVGISQEGQNVVACMDVLMRMCSCDPAPAKTARYNQCQQNYIAFVSRSPAFSTQLLSKVNDSRISFYLNNQLLSTISR